MKHLSALAAPLKGTCGPENQKPETVLNTYTDMGFPVMTKMRTLSFREIFQRYAVQGVLRLNLVSVHAPTNCDGDRCVCLRTC